MGDTKFAEQETPSPSLTQDRLVLSTGDKQLLGSLADQVVVDTAAYYNRFRFTDKRVVDPTAWKDVSHRDNLIVYRERSGHRPTYPSIRSVDNTLQLIPSKSVLSLKVIGMLQGTLDDEMYGCFIGSDDSVKMRKAIAGPMMDNFHWLATIAEPSEGDPFRFCGVASCTYGISLPFTKKREAFIVVSMGITTTQHGERMGYYVAHSVDLSEPLGNQSIIRAKCSFCWLKTELSNGKIELFMKGFSIPMGIVPEFAILPILVNVVSSVGMTTDSAYSKKLAWMMYDSGKTGLRATLPPMNVCVGRCKNKFGGLMSNTSLRRCIVCRKAVCNTCQVVRKIPVIGADGRATLNKGSVCILCIHQAKTTSAVVFVRRELLGKRWKSLDVARMSSTSSTEREMLLTPRRDKTFYLTS